jgi:hypothetical protein
MNLKQKAYGAVRRAIAQGKLVRPPNCSKCGSVDIKGSDGRSTIHAHHHDYTKPLDVEWICVKCHRIETPMPRYRAEQPLIRGERNGSHVLKDFQVLEIKASKLTHRKLGEIYGVDRSTITRIKSGDIRKWTASPTAPIDDYEALNGREVSMDVSTGDDDIGNRIFGNVIGIQDGIILVEETARNFAAPIDNGIAEALEKAAKAIDDFASSGENKDDWTITRDLAFYRAAEVVRSLIPTQAKNCKIDYASSDKASQFDTQANRTEG